MKRTREIIETIIVIAGAIVWFRLLTGCSATAQATAKMLTQVSTEVSAVHRDIGSVVQNGVTGRQMVVLLLGYGLLATVALESWQWCKTKMMRRHR